MSARKVTAMRWSQEWGQRRSREVTKAHSHGAVSTRRGASRGKGTRVRKAEMILAPATRQSLMALPGAETGFRGGRDENRDNKTADSSKSSAQKEGKDRGSL